MSKEYVPTTMQIIKCFEKEEEDEIYNLINEAEYSDDWGCSGISREEFDILMKNQERYLDLKGNLPNGLHEPLESYLEEKGIPFKRWSEAGIEFDHDLVVFDGVRSHTTLASKDGEPLVEMSAIKTILERLEEPDKPGDDLADLKTFSDVLAIANYHWVNTDINTFYRYGMEGSVAFSPNAKGDDGTIDVEVKEQETPLLGE